MNEFKDFNQKWLRYIQLKEGRHWSCSGQVWQAMSQRCKLDGSFQNAHPSYVGCTMSENFKDFQFFVEWHMQQIGYGFYKYQLDKDILIKGNRIYDCNTCVLIPQSLNKFLCDRERMRGEWPLGVDFHKQRDKFRARINIGGMLTYLGHFNTPQEAYHVYKIAKEKEARRWYCRLLNKEFIVDERVIEALRTWVLN